MWWFIFITTLYSWILLYLVYVEIGILNIIVD